MMLEMMIEDFRQDKGQYKKCFDNKLSEISKIKIFNHTYKVSHKAKIIFTILGVIAVIATMYITYCSLWLLMK